MERQTLSAAFQQRFHYAIRGVVPGLFFMVPMAFMLSTEQNLELWAMVSLFCLGALGGFFGGAMLDKVERCGYDPGNEYSLVYYVFLTLLAASIGATLSGFATAQPVMGDPEMVTVVGLLGAWPGLIAALWLESLREPAIARARKRGGLLPTGAWALLWIALACIEIYALWDFTQNPNL
jgi:hypothetical protein